MCQMELVTIKSKNSFDFNKHRNTNTVEIHKLWRFTSTWTWHPAFTSCRLSWFDRISFFKIGFSKRSITTKYHDYPLLVGSRTASPPLKDRIVPFVWGWLCIFIMLSSLADKIFLVVKMKCNQALSINDVLHFRQPHSYPRYFGFTSVQVTMQRTSHITSRAALLPTAFLLWLYLTNKISIATYEPALRAADR